jgi:hypothetical protein
MRVLGIDPGGEKYGWGVTESGPRYIDSGWVLHPRRKRDYQPYRMELTRLVRREAHDVIDSFAPDRIVVEVVPPFGSEGYMRGGQGYIANIVATTWHNVAMELGFPVEQVSARTWSSRMALRQSKSERVTKPKIRNGVLYHLPELRKKLATHLKEWDRWDAIGMTLFHLGYRTLA